MAFVFYGPIAFEQWAGIETEPGNGHDSEDSDYEDDEDESDSFDACSQETTPPSMPDSAAETMPATQEELDALQMLGREPPPPPGNGPTTWQPLPVPAHAYHYLGDGEHSSGDGSVDALATWYD